MQVLDYITSGSIYFEFGQLVHECGSDYVIYKRNWRKAGFRPGTTELGAVVAAALMQDGTGVESVELRSYVVQACSLSSALSSSYVIEAVRTALRKNGYTIIDQPREVGSPYKGLQVSELDSPYLIARVLVRSTALRCKRAGKFLGTLLLRGAQGFPRPW